MSRIVNNWHHADGAVTDANAECWGTYTRGMDEWVPHKDRQAAEKYAVEMNRFLVDRSSYHEHEPWTWVTPDLWPFGRENHAAALKREASA